MANPETPVEDGGARPVIIAACLTAILGLGTGVSISAFMMPAAEQAGETGLVEKKSLAQTAQHGNETGPQGHEGRENTEVTEESIDLTKLTFAPFPPVIVNLREQNGSWVRIEGGIQYISDGEIPADAIGPLAAEMAMNYFRTLTVRELEGGDGLQLIKMDLTEIARSLSKGQIRGFTFTSFIIE